MNDLKIKPIQEGESYRYLGQDEKVAYDGAIKQRNITPLQLLLT